MHYAGTEFPATKMRVSALGLLEALGRNGDTTQLKTLDDDLFRLIGAMVEITRVERSSGRARSLSFGSTLIRSLERGVKLDLSAEYIIELSPQWVALYSADDDQNWQIKSDRTGPSESDANP